MKQVINHNKDYGLLNMIGRTDPMLSGGGNCGELADGKIQVTVWHMEGGSKVSDNHTDNPGYEGKGLASTNTDHTGGARITAYVWPG